MNQRRFNDLSRGHPEDVKPLAASHPAMRKQRTLFPSTVISAAEADNVLVSGHNNRKIGKEITKGRWKGMPIYTLTLEERATCPSDCYLAAVCYGNAMHMARRIKADDSLVEYLRAELIDLQEEHPQGFVVRLHVLGDFYSPDYAAAWLAFLDQFSALHIYGYTARKKGDGIGDVIETMNRLYPDQCLIRFSSSKPEYPGATVINYMPEQSRVPEGLVCPAETSDAECCASCGLCWSPDVKEPIVFIAHGMGASTAKTEAREAGKTQNGLRPVRAMVLPSLHQAEIAGHVIDYVDAAPTDLFVDEAYQRRLTAKSVKLIRRLVANWDWRKFNPPTVVKTESGALHVVDGQHTAIAAASRKIPSIKIKLVDRAAPEDRAGLFVDMNSNRLAVTNQEIFYAELAAGRPEAKSVKSKCDKADLIILRQPPARNEYGPGETMAVMTLRRIERVHTSKAQRIFDICGKAKVGPVLDWMLTATTLLLTKKEYQPAIPDAEITRMLAASRGNLWADAHTMRAQKGMRIPAAAAEFMWGKYRGGK